MIGSPLENFPTPFRRYVLGPMEPLTHHIQIRTPHQATDSNDSTFFEYTLKSLYSGIKTFYVDFGSRPELIMLEIGDKNPHGR